MTTRRKLLQSMTAAPLLVALPPALRAQGALRTTALGGSLTLIQGAGSNVVVAEGSNGLVVVNGGRPEQAEALLAEIGRLSGDKPVAALFNTSWRPEFCGLNHLLGPRGTRIIAHENTRLWQGADLYIDWQDTHYKPLPTEVQANDTFYKTGSMQLDDELIEYGFISQANTDGDIYVHFTGADVLVVGSMLVPNGWPLMDYASGGWIGGAQAATTGLLERAGDHTKLVAASGGVVGRQQLEEQAGMLAHAYERVSWAFQNGKSVEEFLASDPMQDFRSSRGDPELFLTLLYKSTWYRVPGRAVRNII